MTALDHLPQCEDRSTKAAKLRHDVCAEVELLFENARSGERFRVTLKENEFSQGKSVCECLIEVL